MKEIESGTSWVIADSSEAGKVFYKTADSTSADMCVSYFNERGEKIKYIAGNTTTGLTVWESVFDTSGKEVTSYRFESPTTEIKSGKYSYVRNYNCAADLENDSIIRYIIDNKKIDVTFKYEYDKNGNETRELMFDSLGLSSEVISEYDKNNNLIKSTSSGRRNRGLVRTFQYTYDDRNNMLTSKSYDDFGRPSLAEYKYDSLNNVVEYRDHYNGELRYISHYYYEGKKKTLTIQYEPPGQLSTRGYSEYDENGQVIKTTRLDYQKNEKRIWRVIRVIKKKPGQRLVFN